MYHTQLQASYKYSYSEYCRCTTQESLSLAFVDFITRQRTADRLFIGRTRRARSLLFCRIIDRARRSRNKSAEPYVYLEPLFGLVVRGSIARLSVALCWLIGREGEREGRGRAYIREILGANCKTAVPLRSAQKRTRLGVSVASLTKVIARPCVTCASISVALVCRVCRVHVRARARAETRARARRMCERISHAREIVLLTCGIPFITASFYSTAVRESRFRKDRGVQRFRRGSNSSILGVSENGWRSAKPCAIQRPFFSSNRRDNFQDTRAANFGRTTPSRLPLSLEE